MNNECKMLPEGEENFRRRKVSNAPRKFPRLFTISQTEKQKDYRHYLCALITLASLSCGVLFPNSLPRIAESLRDFGTSLAYYCQQIFEFNYIIRPTVIDMPAWEFAPSRWEPIKLLPYTWEEFKLVWQQYWDVFISKENLIAYLYKLTDVLYYLTLYVFASLPLIAVGALVFWLFMKKKCYVRGKKSKPLQLAEKFTFSVIYPIISWIKSFVQFVKENKMYWRAWLCIWMLHFNAFPICISAVAWLLYFSVSRDPVSLYIQALKLLEDLTPVIRFIPGVIWTVIIITVYNYICRKMAMENLDKSEAKNEAFIEERSIVCGIASESGSGKTYSMTGMLQTSQNVQFKNAYDSLMKFELMFPNFPWQNLRDVLEDKIERRQIVDLRTCEKHVRLWSERFDFIRKFFTYSEYHSSQAPFPDYTLGYDFEHYAVEYNDNVRITKLFEAVEEYSKAYLIFTVRTTLLYANYSIRSDGTITFGGNMPERDMDFFRKDPRDMMKHSQYAHIIDMGMFRLGTKMLEDNPKARGMILGSFGVTELDKEWLNADQLKEVKASDPECNQKNDLHNTTLMTMRQAAVIDFKTYVFFIGDMQRAEAWGVSGRGCGEMLKITDKEEYSPALPILSPYWVCKPIFSLIKKGWNKFHDKYIVNRCDDTLFVHCFNNVICKMNNHYDKIEGLYGRRRCKIDIQDGNLEGKVRKGVWIDMRKKQESDRYLTGCLQSLYEPLKANTMHIDDYEQYGALLGTLKENLSQNSFLQNKVGEIKGLIPKKQAKSKKTKIIE